MMLTEALNSLWAETLQEIKGKIEIHSDYVSHTDYPSDRPAEEFTKLFQQLSIELQHRYLKLELQDLLYRVYFSRNVNLPTEKDIPLANNTVRGVNLQFFEALQNSNCGTGYYDRGWQVRKQEEDGMLAVYKNRLTTHIQRDRHLSEPERNADVGDAVSVLLPNSTIDNHYYVAISNFGSVYEPTTDFFFNVKSEVATSLVYQLTQNLMCPFALRVAFDPDDYERCDSGILSVHRSDYSSVYSIVKSFYRSHSSSFLESVPFLTKRIGKGLAIAESSIDLPFGQHRCGLIAEALIAGEPIAHPFTKAGLDLAQPYLDRGSSDCYELDLERETIA